MQALSFAVHIPLVCFGVAFPAMVLFVEWLGRRRGDPLSSRSPRRWSKAMIALFAVGVVTGTILSFELGLLWPEFMATFGDVFGLAFALEGFSFFLEAIFIAIYVYGWDRLSPRAHFSAGIPVVIAGFTGSLIVIAVNGWMNDPTGFRLEDGRRSTSTRWARCSATYFWHELMHMYLAGFIVAGFVVGGRLRLALAARAARPLRAHGAGHRRSRSRRSPRRRRWSWATGRRGRWPRTSRPSWPRSRAWADDRGRAAPRRRLVRRDDGEVRCGVEIPKLLSLLAFHDPNATVRAWTPCPPDDRPPVNVVRFAFLTMVGIGSLLALFGGSAGRCGGVAAALPRAAVVLPRGRRGRAAVGRGADRGLGDHRGRPPALGRLRASCAPRRP